MKVKEEPRPSIKNLKEAITIDPARRVPCQRFRQAVAGVPIRLRANAAR